MTSSVLRVLQILQIQPVILSQVTMSCAGVLNLSQVGKPKQGRPGQRRKASEPSDNDTAAILMNLAAVAGEASGRPGSAKR